MKIIIAEAYPVNPGDLSWKNISSFGELEVYERMPPEEIRERCKNADIILCNKLPFDRATIFDLPRLKLICVMATGYNVVDTKAADEKNITVCNVPGYGTLSVAQHTFALLLEITNHVCIHSKSVENGEWVTAPDWCYTRTPLIELSGKTLGIIGYGNIGRQVAQIALSFGMKILCYTPHPKPAENIIFTDTETLFARSDFVTLHCPLKNDNFQFVNSTLIQLMKPTAFLINTARGQLINEQNLSHALNNGTMAGAALDVLSTEPPQSNNPLLTAKNCIITPHIAWMSREARQRIIAITIQNIRAFLLDKPVNKVN